MDKQAIAKTKATRFKKGQQPHNTKYDGAISIRRDNGTGRDYLYIRVDKAVWQLYNRYLWAKHNGPIPDGHVIRFIDDNTLNCSLENLECISMGENAVRNNQTFGTASQRLTDAMIASYLSGRDPEIKEYILQHRPDLIKVARANYKLNREINKIQ